MLIYSKCLVSVSFISCVVQYVYGWCNSDSVAADCLRSCLALDYPLDQVKLCLEIHGLMKSQEM